MMKRVLKKIVTVNLSLCMAFTCMFLPQTAIANAEVDTDIIKYEIKITVTRYSQSEKGFDSYYIDMGNRGKGADRITATSSKKSVVKVKCYNDPEDALSVVIEARKPGTSKLVIKIKRNGKVKKYKCTVKVIKYKNPIKSFKIGKKNYAKRFKKSPFATIAPVTGKAKVSIKPNR